MYVASYHCWNIEPWVEDMLYLLGNFSGCFAGGGWVHNSPFTHTHTYICSYHEWGPTLGSEES